MSEYLYDLDGVPRALGMPHGPAQLDEFGRLIVEQLPNGLGGGLPIGTTAGTVAAGNDARIVAVASLTSQVASLTSQLSSLAAQVAALQAGGGTVTPGFAVTFFGSSATFNGQPITFGS